MANRVVVIGHYPAYILLAEQLGADAFSLSDTIWLAMSENQRWTANREFLDLAIADGAVFVLATPPLEIEDPSYLVLELEYLISAGYTERRGAVHWELAR